MPMYQHLGHEAMMPPSVPWWQTNNGLLAILGAVAIGLIVYAVRMKNIATTATSSTTFMQYSTSAAVADQCDFGPCLREFYMYRAQSENNYPMQNVNAASLAGVMWYLHNEIVQSIPRKYDVTRIMRLKVTMRNPQAWWDAHQAQFGQYVAFDQAMCTVPDCQNIWDTYGAVVGCQAPNPDVANYTADHQTSLRCDNGHCNSPLWYSLPGPCPSMYYGQKTQECIDESPGGFCFSSYNETTGLGDKDDWKVTGAWNCSYHVDWAGQVRLDDLVGIGNYSDFVAAGYQEYDKIEDVGYGTDFWNGIHNATACQLRMERLKDLFVAKVGENAKFPRDLPEPVCDAP